MQFKEIQDILIGILRAELTETEVSEEIVQKIDKEAISQLYKFANQHYLAHIVAGYLNKAGLLKNDDVSNSLKKIAITTAFKAEYTEYALNQVCDIFNECGIPFIPLKGSVLKRYYPQDNMRTSCDIDVLVKKENIDFAVEMLVQKGAFILEKRNYHDVLLVSKNKINLELHFSVTEDIKKLDCVLENVWSYAKPKSGFQYELSDEFFIFYIFAHMAYHFIGGGCGMRSLMDLWVIKYKMGLDFKVAETLLKKAQISTFAEKIVKLSDYCFSNGKSDEYTDSLLYYIITGGTYGSMENKFAYEKTENPSTANYVFHRIFVPFGWMKRKYNILEKHPYLLPVFYVVRVWEAIFSKREHSMVDEVKINRSVSQEHIDSVSVLKEYLEL